MSAKSDYLEDALLNHVLRNTAMTSPTTVYVALSFADPTDAGSGLSEPTGSWYARQAATFDDPAGGGATANSAEIDFTNAGADTVTADDDTDVVTHFAVMDALTNGNVLYHGALTANKTLNTGDEVTIAAGALDITEA